MLVVLQLEFAYNVSFAALAFVPQELFFLPKHKKWQRMFITFAYASVVKSCYSWLNCAVSQ